MNNRITINKYIVSDSEICGGKLIFGGTRIMVWQVLDALAHGETNESVLDAWPSITKKHIQAALQLAASRAGSDRIISLYSPDREVLSR